MRTVYYEPASRYPGPYHDRGTPLPLLREALRRAGCELTGIAAPSADPDGLESGDEKTGQAAGQRVESLLASLSIDAEQRPDVWITAGLCPHAPDDLGPGVCRQLGIPYVLLEPRVGPGSSECATPQEKQSAKQTAQQATGIVTTRSEAARALGSLLEDPGRVTHLLPFLDLAPCRSAGQLRDTYRNELARKLAIPSTSACLVTDGPGHEDSALDAWRMLALALSRTVMLDWHLLILARGSVEPEVRQALLRLPAQRVHYWAEATQDERWRAFAGSDLYVGAGTGGSGLASLLEAQATGTPVVACQDPDVADRVLNGQTGRLSAANAESLANGISFLLRHPQFRETYGQQARELAASQHDLRAAATALRDILSKIVSGAPR